MLLDRPNGVSPSGLPTKICMPCPTLFHPPLFDNSINILWIVRIMELLIMQFSLASFYSICEMHYAEKTN
jgi:hypothetical protein